MKKENSLKYFIQVFLTFEYNAEYIFNNFKTKTYISKVKKDFFFQINI